MIDFTCRICGNTTNNKLFVVKEKMFGTQQPFNYIECSQCGCMQIEDENLDLKTHYPDEYFSFNTRYKPNKVKDFIGKQYCLYKMGKLSII